MKLLPLAVVLVVVALAVPAAATHPNTRTVAYTAGAGFSTGSIFLSTVWCPQLFWDLTQSCLGGGFPQTQLHSPLDFGNGYQHIVVNVNDAAFGPNVGSVGCLKPSWSDTRCSPDDPSQRSCGLALDLRTYGEFYTTFAAVFVWTVYFDTATSQICLSSTGSITAFFTNG